MKNFIKHFFKHKNESPFIDAEDAFIIIRMGRSKLTAIKFDAFIEIGDIQTEKNNRGHGTAMMSMLINYAKEEGYSLITGWISQVDIDHIDRLKHFYGKFGFVITPTKEKQTLEAYTLELKL